MKFLIIRFSPTSNVILSSLLIRCLRKRFPDSEIHFLTNDNNRFAVEFNPHINKLHVLAHSRELMVEELSQEGYSHIIDLENNAVTAEIKNGSSAETFSVNNYSFRQKIYRSFKINLLPKEHLAERFLQTMQALEVKNDGAGLDYFIAQGGETKKHDIPTSHHAGYIACVIGDDAGVQWPLEKWTAFCTTMDHPLILLGEKKDAGQGNQIASIDSIKIYNACGKFSFNEQADLVKNSKVVVSATSGLLYVACAYKRPVVWLNDEKLPAGIGGPYYSEYYLPGKSKPAYTSCGFKEEAGEVIKQVLAFL